MAEFAVFLDIFLISALPLEVTFKCKHTFDMLGHLVKKLPPRFFKDGLATEGKRARGSIFVAYPWGNLKMRATFKISPPIMHYCTWLPVTRYVCSAWCPHVRLGFPSSSQQTCGFPWWHGEPSSWIHWGRESKDPDWWKGAGRGSGDPSPNMAGTLWTNGQPPHLVPIWGDQWTAAPPCPELRQPFCYRLLQSVMSTTVQVHPPGGLDGWRGLGRSDRAGIQQGAPITQPG